MIQNRITVVTVVFEWKRAELTIALSCVFTLVTNHLTHVMQLLLISYRVNLLFAPHFDQTLVSGLCVTSSNVSDDVLVQLEEDNLF